MRYILIGVDFTNITDTKKDIDRGVITKQLDLICSCIRSALFISEGVRKSTETVIFDPDFNKIIVLKSFKLKYMGPDLRSISLLILKALDILRKDLEKQAYYSTPGIYVIQESFIEYLKNLSDAYGLIYYTEYSSSNETIKKIDSNILIVYFEPAVKDKILKKLKEFNLKPLQFNSKVPLTPNEFIIIYQNYLDLIFNEP